MDLEIAREEKLEEEKIGANGVDLNDVEYLCCLRSLKPPLRSMVEALICALFVMFEIGFHHEGPAAWLPYMTAGLLFRNHATGRDD